MRGGGAVERLALASAIVVAGIAAVVWWHAQDRDLGTARAEVALRERLHTPYGFRCRTEHDDGTIGLPGVDYLEPIDHAERTGWISTDATRITGLQPTG